MEGMSWMKILSGVSLASLLLAGCGGGSGGGSDAPSAAPITTPEQAQQAAASFLLLRSDALSHLISSPVGVESSAKVFSARIASENLPETKSFLVIQTFLAKAAPAMTVQKAALTVTNCTVSGTISEDYVEKPDGGGFKSTTTYDNCREDSLLINGTYSLEEIYSGATTQSIVIEGNGDQDVNDETDLVIQVLDSGIVWKASGTDSWSETVVTDTSTLFASNQSSSFKGMYTYNAVAETFSFSANMSDTGTSINTLSNGIVTHTEEEFVSNGTMAFSGIFSGESVGLSFAANQLKTKDVYDLTSTGEAGRWEASGNFATVMTPATCLAGSYTIKTIEPIEYSFDYSSGEETTSAGEIELNSAARVLLSNDGTENIVTVYLGTDPTPVFTGSAEELAAATLEACPIFGFAILP